MDLKEAVTKLKHLIFEHESSQIKLAEVKLKDGSVIVIEGEAPAVGAMVSVVTVDGSVPAPDRDYEAEDGTIVVVKDGKVAEIKEAVAMAGDPAPADGGDKVAELEKRISDLEASMLEKIKAIEDKMGAFSKQESELKTELEAQKKIAVETFSIVEKIAESPVEKGVKQEFKIDQKQDSVSSILEALNKIKSKK